MSQKKAEDEPGSVIWHNSILLMACLDELGARRPG